MAHELMDLPFEMAMTSDMLREYIIKENAIIEYESRASEQLACEVPGVGDTSSPYTRGDEDVLEWKQNTNTKNRRRDNRIR